MTAVKEGAPSIASGSPGELPIKLGRYTLLEVMGAGGMGVVYRATLEGIAGFEKVVAVKCILPHLVRESPEFVEALISEAKLSVKMSHPNIVQVNDLGQIGDHVYVSMEHVDGLSLARILQNVIRAGRQLSIDAVATIIAHVTAALDYAHNLTGDDGEPLGIVHRDISPTNILISKEGAVKLIDFGIAKAATNLSMTDPGVIKGKLGYLSPEQLSGRNIDRRADVFATGIVLYETLAGRRLFAGSTQIPALGDLLTTRVPDIREVRPDIPEWLVAAVMRSLQREPARRFQTAAQLGAVLRQNARILDPVALAKELAPAMIDSSPSPGGRGSLLPGLSGVHEAPTRADLSTSSRSRTGSAVPTPAPAAPAPASPAQTAPAPAAPARRRPWAWSLAALAAVALLGGVVKLVLMQPAGGTIYRASAPAPAPTIEAPAVPHSGHGQTAGADAVANTGSKTDGGASVSPPPQSPSKRPAKPPPRPAVEAPLRELTAAEIETAIRRNQSKFGACIRQNFDPKTQPEGVVYVRLKILASGKVESVGIRPDAYADSGLATCLQTVAGKLRLRKHSEAFVEIEFPFEIRVRAD